jgi:Rop-like
MQPEEAKKELATLKRKATEIASKIHDIVEDTLWTEYELLKTLAQEIGVACDKYHAFKKEHGL